jgi:predicted alpha/beta-fold hydrolase
VDQLDVQLTALYGYDNSAEYKRQDSPIHASTKIAIPTLSISAADDPISCIEGRPSAAQIGPGLVLVTTPYGGHIAFPARYVSERCHVNKCGYGEKASLASVLQCTWTDGLILDWFEHFR